MQYDRSLRPGDNSPQRIYRQLSVPLSGGELWGAEELSELERRLVVSMDISFV